MSLGRHTVLNLIGAFAPMAISIITVPLYLRTIGPDRFGALAILWAVLAHFNFLDLGLGRALSQRLARMSFSADTEKSELAWTAIVATATISAAGALAISVGGHHALLILGGERIAKNIELQEAVRWLPAMLPLLLLSSTLQGALQARLRFGTVNLIQVLAAILSQGLPLAAALAGHERLTHLVAAVTVARTLTLIALFLAAIFQVPLGLPVRLRRDHLNHLMSYGGWVSITTVIAPLLVTVDRFVIARVAGAAAVAAYTVPYDVAFKTIVVAGSIAGALTPRLAAASPEEARALANRVTALMIGLATPATIVAILSAQPLLQAWIGEEAAQRSRNIAQVIFVGIWFHAIVTPHHSRLLAQDSPRIIVIVYLLELPIYIGALWLGVATLGIAGAAIAWSFRVALDAAFLLHAAGSLPETARRAWPSLVAVFAAAAVATLNTSSLQKSFTGALALVFAIFVNRKELLQLARMLNRTTSSSAAG